MPTAAWWRAFYAGERRDLGEAGLLALLEAAPSLRVPARGALVFPHSRLSHGGEQPAAVARALVECGCDEVLALGVLHGGRERDAARVKAARSGGREARAALRRVHGPGTAGDEGAWEEEFSLDNLRALVEVEARRRGRRAPRLVERYPFLVGDVVEDLPGLDELRELVARGVPVVATADHVHHGVGYGTAREAARAREDEATHEWVRGEIRRSVALLERGALAEFARHAKEAGSDFRDAGPVVAALRSVRPWSAEIVTLALAPYDDVLGCDAPTWVAAALLVIDAAG